MSAQTNIEPTQQEIKIAELELRINRLETDLAAIRANYYKTALPIYEPIPYYFHPNFKMPEAT